MGYPICGNSTELIGGPCLEQLKIKLAFYSVLIQCSALDSWGPLEHLAVTTQILAMVVRNSIVAIFIFLVKHCTQPLILLVSV